MARRKRRRFAGGTPTQHRALSRAAKACRGKRRRSFLSCVGKKMRSQRKKLTQRWKWR